MFTHLRPHVSPCPPGQDSQGSSPATPRAAGMPRFLRAALCFAAALSATIALAEEPLKLPSAVGAHRGGRGEFPENTLYAYQQCAERWPDVLLEGDIHQSADGVPVLLHDLTLDRTTNGTGKIASKTLDELRELDAAYNFTTDGGKTFPLRGKGITIPTLAEVLAATPTHYCLFELKGGPTVVDAVIAVIREANASSRVTLASFNPIYMKQLREKAPEISTCYDTQTAMQMVLALRSPNWEEYTPVAKMLTFSPSLLKTMSLTPEELLKIRAKGVHLQAHTLNSESAMNEYLDIGVDSILTDYPTKLAAVIAGRNTQAEAPAE
jgi:glycerophosphoryl diester phosphodiesterase